MKKILLTLIPLAAAANCSFAELLLTTPYTYADGTYAITTETTMVSGTGTVADFGETLSYPSLYLNAANIAFDDSSKILTLTATGTQASGGLSVSSGSAWYSMIMKNSTLTFSNGGGITINTSMNAISAYMGNTMSTINVNADAGAVVLNKVYANAGVVTLNLNKANAFTTTTGTGAATIGSSIGNSTNVIVLNMSQDQKLSFDLRTNVNMLVNITNNAVLTVNAVTIQGYTSGTSATIKIAGGALADEAMLFFSNSSAQWNESSWNDTTKSLVVTSGAYNFTYKFRGENGTDLADINWVATDGGWNLTSVPEPAVYAAILGACALAFTLYRRKRA